MEESDIDLGDLLTGSDNTSQNTNEFINKGSPVKIKPIFTKSPLPDELLFEGYENFLHFLPCFGYYDETFCNNVLSKNYQKSLTIIEKQISICNEAIEKHTQELHEIENKNLVPEKAKLNYLNSKFWRESVILYWTEIKYRKKLNEKRIKAYQHNLYILKRLISIIQELRVHIRYIAILYSSIESITKNLTKGFESKLRIRIRAASLALSDKQFYLGLLPQPFLDFEKAKSQIVYIIKSSQKYVDPTTHYLCESNLNAMFEDFMKSDFSPLKSLESKYDIEKQFDQIINSSMKAVRAFSELKDSSYNEIIGLLVSRFWFSRTLICKYDMMRENNLFRSKLNEMRSQYVKNLSPPKSCFKIFNFELTSIEFFERNSYLSQSIDSFDSCIFLLTPEDIMKEIHLIHLSFAGYVATQLKTNINDSIVNEGVQFLWKLLFIVSSIPNVDSVIRFVHRFMDFICYPKILFESFKFPLQVCKSLQ